MINSLAVLVACAVAQEDISLEWKLRAGDRIVSKSEVSQDVSRDGTARTMSMLVESEARVVSVDGEGVITAELGFSTVRLRMKQGEDEEASYVYEPGKEPRAHGPDPFLKMTEKLADQLGAKHRVSISPNGKVRPATGIREGGEFVRIAFGFIPVELPPGKVRKGGSWDHQTRIGLPGPDFGGRVAWTIGATGDGVVRADGRLTDPDGREAGRSSFEFDLEKGCLGKLALELDTEKNEWKSKAAHLLELSVSRGK